METCEPTQYANNTVLDLLLKVMVFSEEWE